MESDGKVFLVLRRSSDLDASAGGMVIAWPVYSIGLLYQKHRAKAKVISDFSMSSLHACSTKLHCVVLKSVKRFLAFFSWQPSFLPRLGFWASLLSGKIRRKPQTSRSSSLLLARALKVTFHSSHIHQYHELDPCRSERSQSHPVRLQSRTNAQTWLRRCRARQDPVDSGSSAPGTCEAGKQRWAYNDKRLGVEEENWGGQTMVWMDMS